MISFSTINKQYGKQLLFVDASFQLNPGKKCKVLIEKVNLEKAKDLRDLRALLQS